MKKTFYIKTAFLSLMGMSLLSSCLKDSRYINFAGSQPLIELPAAANVTGAAGPFEVVGLLASSSAPSTFKVAVNIAAPNPLSTATTVTLSANADSLTKYNTDNNTTYTLLPAADYNASSLSVTIPAGQNLGYVTVAVNTSLLDPSQSYVLPLTITNGGGHQISNYNTILYNLVIKNAYDGVYTETGYKFHPTAGVSHPLTGSATISTITAVTSQTAVGDLAGNGYYFDFDVNGSTLSNWVAVGAPPAPASGFFTADNPGGIAYTTTDGSQPGKAPYVQTTYNNTYNAATKTFFMHYGYGSGSTNQSGWSRNFYVELVAQ